MPLPGGTGDKFLASRCQILVERFAGQHAGGEFAGPQALGKLDRQLAVGGRFAGMGAGCVAHAVEHFLAAAQAQLIDRQTHSPHQAVRLVLLEESVEPQRVLHLGRRQLEQLGDLDHRLQRHAAQVAR